LESYHRSGPSSSKIVRTQRQGGAVIDGEPLAVVRTIAPTERIAMGEAQAIAAPRAPLVTTHISQHGTGIDVYPRAVKVATSRDNVPQLGGGLRGKIDSFSWASKRRLMMTAENAFPDLITQFALTYHKSQPDGKTVKKHLNTFLTAFRRKYQGATYLWILEFQSRGVPHFHLFISLRHDLAGLGQWLGETWNRIAEPESKAHLEVHTHPNNLIAWSMETAGYLCKYLDKDAQKRVPAGFTEIGRFWGASRGIVPEPIAVKREHIEEAYNQVDIETGEITFDAWAFIVRTLRRHLKASWRGKRRSKYPVTTFRKGARIFKQIESYLYHQKSEAAPF
jgi:hypothetical protein